MFEDIKNINHEVHNFNSKSSQEIEDFRISYLGKKGKITQLFNKFKEVPVSDKKEFGKQLNILKTAALDKIWLRVNRALSPAKVCIPNRRICRRQVFD